MVLGKVVAGFKLIGVVCAFMLTSQVALAGDGRTVLAVGDSITAGGHSFRVYREFLVPALKEKGVAVEFLGPNKDKTSAHAGFGGKNTAYLNKSISKIYRAHPADIVLIHSGHNSFAKNKPVPAIIRDTEGMIAQIHGINPKATIFLAQVITAGRLPKYSYIPELNQELGLLAARLKKAGHPVVLVDQETDFDWQTDTVKDRVHPNANGARKMANKWLEALLPLLKP